MSLSTKNLFRKVGLYGNLYHQTTNTSQHVLPCISDGPWKMLLNPYETWGGGDLRRFMLRNLVLHIYNTLKFVGGNQCFYLRTGGMEDKVMKKTQLATGWPIGKDMILQFERGSTRSSSLENWLWKRPWICLKADRLRDEPRNVRNLQPPCSG